MNKTALQKGSITIRTRSFTRFLEFEECRTLRIKHGRRTLMGAYSRTTAHDSRIVFFSYIETERKLGRRACFVSALETDARTKR